jgi:hypothetical protein
LTLSLGNEKITIMNLNSADCNLKLKTATQKIPKAFFVHDVTGAIVATRPDTGSAIAFNSVEKKWDFSPRTYYQIIADTVAFSEITEEKAKMEFKNNLPDEKLLDKLDSFRGL